MHNTAVFPGSFDPVTIGHMDIITRAAGIFDHVHVLVAQNSEKQCMFDIYTRLRWIKTACEQSGLINVTVTSCDGLVTDFMKQNGITNIVRSVRSSADAEYETILYNAYRSQLPQAELVLLPAKNELRSIASGVVREMVHRRGSIDNMVPECVKIEINKEMEIE